MGHMKRLFESIYNEEMMLEKYHQKLDIKERMFFERNGDDVELIGFEKYEDSGLGDDQPSTA